MQNVNNVVNSLIIVLIKESNVNMSVFMTFVIAKLHNRWNNWLLIVKNTAPDDTAKIYHQTVQHPLHSEHLTSFTSF